MLLVLILLAVDVAVAALARAVAQGPDVRQLKRDPAGLLVMVESIRDNPGYTVAFIGDSQMYGPAVRDESQTVAGHFRGLVDTATAAVCVYNLGMKGYGPGEVLYVADALADSGVDLVVYNLSLGWFDREQPVTVPAMDHLLPLGGRPASALAPQVAALSAGRKLQLFTRQRWQLLAHRHLVRETLLGLAGISDPFLAREDPDLFRRWDQSHFPPGVFPVFGSFRITPDNPNLQVFATAVRRLTASGVRVFVYISPQNRALYEQLAEWDEPGHRANVELVQAVATAAGALFADYSQLLTAEHFSDSIHLFSAGHRELALRLRADIDTAVGGRP